MTNSPENPEPDNPVLEILERYTQAVESQRYDEAEAISAELLEQILAKVPDDVSPAFELWCEAHAHELLGQWDEAEAAYRRVLALPDADAADRQNTHKSLCELFQLLGREADALREARLSTAAARTHELDIALALALTKQAGCELRADQADEAEIAVAEALSLMRDEPGFDQLRGLLLIMRAECALRKELLVDAADDLDASYQLLAPMGALTTAAGVQSNLVAWWRAMARSHAAEGDLEAAIGAWQETVERARHVVSIWDEDSPHAQRMLADMLGGLSAALKDGGRLEDARPADAEREDILTRIRLPREAWES